MYLDHFFPPFKAYLIVKYLRSPSSQHKAVSLNRHSAVAVCDTTCLCSLLQHLPAPHQRTQLTLIETSISLETCLLCVHVSDFSSSSSHRSIPVQMLHVMSLYVLRRLQAPHQDRGMLVHFDWLVLFRLPSSEINSHSDCHGDVAIY